MQIGVITLFPLMFSALEASITGRALKAGLFNLQFWNPREFTTDKHHTVDDRPYGGGPGMLMKVEPLRQAIQAAKTVLPHAKTIYLSPQGQRFSQAAAKTLANQQQLIFIAGRYEGIDERLITTEINEEWSIGDYVVTGGELPTMVVIDAITRLLPGVLGDEQSAAQDSFSAGLLDCPHYTRPEVIAEQQVPEILLSGHHEKIARWREQQALGRTWLRRPDLLEKLSLNDEQKQLLAEFIKNLPS